jgi:protein-L-isoaspartate(D-aspartate) O-methyltransferase
MKTLQSGAPRPSPRAEITAASHRLATGAKLRRVRWLVSVLTLVLGAAVPATIHGQAAAPAPSPAASADPTRAAREAMVARQIADRGISDRAVLAALRKVPRHRFVPAEVTARAYDDSPLPIGHEQTISQPYIVALMTELAAVGRGARVLEIGTGSGYQAAVLAELGAEVYSIEIVAPLGKLAAETLRKLGYGAVKTRIGDGYRGWREAAPFDAIVVTAAPPKIPEPLKQQLKVGGRLVVPVGEQFQQLKVITRTASGWDERGVLPVRFVPMVGEAGGKRR